MGSAKVGLLAMALFPHLSEHNQNMISPDLITIPPTTNTIYFMCDIILCVIETQKETSYY